MRDEWYSIVGFASVSYESVKVKPWLKVFTQLNELWDPRMIRVRSNHYHLWLMSFEFEEFYVLQSHFYRLTEPRGPDISTMVLNTLVRRSECFPTYLDLQWRSLIKEFDWSTENRSRSYLDLSSVKGVSVNVWHKKVSWFISSNLF